MKIDGHIHTPFCPHGTQDPFEAYIEKAISNGFHAITFTEHAPLPVGFIDPTPNKDSGMELSNLHNYLQKLSALKNQYAAQITINIGLEVDYIAGFEEQTKAFLDEYGPYLDDAILSVHFLKNNDYYTCIDFSKEVYLDFANKIGGTESMYNLYYETVRKSVLSDLGTYKPKRIGHPTLVHKFQLANLVQVDDSEQIKAILLFIKQHGYSIDFNSAGLSKTFCKESYPPKHYLPFIESIQLPFVFGSDAHTVIDLHQHYDILFK